MYAASLTQRLLAFFQLDLSSHISSLLIALTMALMDLILYKLEKLILIHSKNEQN